MAASTDNRSSGEQNYKSERVAIGTDIRVFIHSFEGEQSVPWHLHTEVTDMFFCLEGVGRIELQSPAEEVSLAVGQRYDVTPGRKHRVSSADGAPCRMILIQGIGKADFHLTDAPER